MLDIIFSNISSTWFSLFFWDSNCMCITCSDIVPHILETLYFFQFLLFFFSLQVCWFSYYLLRLLFKMFGYCIFHVCNAHLFFLQSLFYFYFLSVYSLCEYFPSKIKKCLSANCSIWNTSRLSFLFKTSHAFMGLHM